MNKEVPPDDRRARYLIAGAVLLLLILVGGIFLAIGLIRGDDTSTGDQAAPAPALVSAGVLR